MGERRCVSRDTSVLHCRDRSSPANWITPGHCTRSQTPAAAQMGRDIGAPLSGYPDLEHDRSDAARRIGRADQDRGLRHGDSRGGAVHAGRVGLSIGRDAGEL